jgi:hypothetical protein
MLFADEGGFRLPRRALITISGRPILLKPTGLKVKWQSNKRISLGDTEEWDFAAQGVQVHVLATVTSACPPDEDSCEYTEYAATIEVTSGTSSFSMDTAGGCGS